jgi:hypothetical protein
MLTLWGKGGCGWSPNVEAGKGVSTGEARWDACMMCGKVLRREREQEKNDRGREKAKEV